MYIAVDTRSLVLICFLSWAVGVISAPFINVISRLYKRVMTCLQKCDRKIPNEQRKEEYEVDTESEDDDDQHIKLVLCVRTDLEMGKGKIAAQCGHAALAAYMHSLDRNNPYLHAWILSGQKKVVVKLKNYEEMAAVRQSAIAAGISHHTTCDAGRTQIPAGSHTVIAIGPAPENAVNRLTGHLKLL